MNSFRYTSVWLLIGWGLVVCVVILSLISAPPDPLKIQSSDKLYHLLAYGALMGWFGQLYSKSLTRMGYCLFFIGLGILLEYLQGLTGYRAFEISDMIANTLGVLLGGWLSSSVCTGWLQRIDQVLTRIASS